MSAAGAALSAEPALMQMLGRIDGMTEAPCPPVEGPSGAALPVSGSIDQRRADALLARIAWSRLVEPSDGIAGALLAAIGAERALELVVRGASARHLDGVLRDHGAEPGRRAAADALERWRPRLDRAKTVGDIECAVAHRMKIVLPDDPGWPGALDDLGEHRPVMLWVRGDIAHLNSYSLGVVGARAATGYGSSITAEIVSGACAAGLTILSGGAYGIDAVAHRTALAAGTPTVAVVAGGADQCYPRAHSTLFERIIGAGAVCTEMAPGSAPTRWRFLMRNRVIAALSRAVLVTEAGTRSGSLNTASHPARV